MTEQKAFSILLKNPKNLITLVLYQGLCFTAFALQKNVQKFLEKFIAYSGLKEKIKIC